MSETSMLICDRCGKSIETTKARQASGEEIWFRIETSRAPGECHPGNKMPSDLCPRCWADHRRFMRHERT